MSIFLRGLFGLIAIGFFREARNPNANSVDWFLKCLCSTLFTLLAIVS